jgi:hypothetical protein
MNETQHAGNIVRREQLMQEIPHAVNTLVLSCSASRKALPRKNIADEGLWGYAYSG